VTDRIERQARMRWVPIADMKINELAQRELNAARVEHLVANFDTEQLGTPTVNHRDGAYYVIDGQHRIRALEQMGWGDQSIQCWVYENLNEQDEAERFLKLNDILLVHALPKYRAAITAGRAEETEIDRVVRAQGLCVTRDRLPGAIMAVGTLRRIYTRSDSATLGRTLRLIRDAYGDAGLEAPVIDGVALVCQRYDGSIEDDDIVDKLSNAHGGVAGLLNKAETLRRSTGNAKSHCVAAAIVDIINRGRGGKRLPSWWKT
jgi:Family of unknown function (DUF6551)